MKTPVPAVLLFLIWLIGIAFAGQFEDIARYPACADCGMSREMFSHSRMLVRYEDGKELPACSLHCAATGMAKSLDGGPAEILVADYGSRGLMNAEKATWVIGGKKPGVMTAYPKWAFASLSDAERFVEAEGGKMVDFDAAIRNAYADMYGDLKMIREKRKMKRLKEAVPGR